LPIKFLSYRLRKQELVTFAQSAEDVLRAVEESAKRELGSSMQSSLEAVTDQPSKPPRERVKIVISVQDKDGLKHFRMYMVYLCAGILDLFTAEKMGLQKNESAEKWVFGATFHGR
jgi:hypothetical protein